MKTVTKDLNASVSGDERSYFSWSVLRTILYWLFTLPVAFEMIAGAVWDLMQIEYVRHPRSSRLSDVSVGNFRHLEISVRAGTAHSGLYAPQRMGLRRSFFYLFRCVRFALSSGRRHRTSDSAARSRRFYACFLGIAPAGKMADLAQQYR